MTFDVDTIESGHTHTHSAKSIPLRQSGNDAFLIKREDMPPRWKEEYYEWGSGAQRGRGRKGEGRHVRIYKGNNFFTSPKSEGLKSNFTSGHPSSYVASGRIGNTFIFYSSVSNTSNIRALFGMEKLNWNIHLTSLFRILIIYSYTVIDELEDN